jgi:thioredoxin 1
MGMLLMGYGLPAQAQSPAPAQGKPALYDFGRGMCLPCKEMEKVLAAIESEYGNQIEVRLVMLEKNEDLFKQFKIIMVPTQVFRDASGKEVDRHVGALTKEQVVQKLKELKFIK